MNDAILLLGAHGFVGNALTRALAAAGAAVVAVGRHPGAAAAPGITTVPAAFAEPAQFAEWLPRCRAVVHLASASTPGSSAGKPLFELDRNLRPTFALLEALQTRPQCELLYLSSGGTLYGDAEVSPATERHVIRPKSYYGAGKAAAEHFITAWSAQFGGHATILRPSNLYGPGQSTRQGFGIIPTAFDALREGTPLTVWGDGSTVRDYLYIDDFVALCLAILARPMPAGTQVLNASSGAGLSLNELFAHIENVAGRPLQRHYVPGRSVDVSRIVLDASRAQHHYDWHAGTPIEAGLSAAWQWHTAAT
ncbi:NAD-dependent epimerase/dehydratase family protein [Aromatoleum toluvorans]|uniref:NAD-dependent epimerase/dehydratase family protein n=1 Tax=Aromatoleum toluvorans TaxID=92002 RepID=A0ABX1Q1M4_9RHOO|nr:NAD-dependent epimerase/dehydratase family protein [Aromatoleum toluvorans]NMG44651.1 NAD-dependent epimerase/dehydratase family protein [Aromatoleum toluvorans]